VFITKTGEKYFSPVPDKFGWFGPIDKKTPLYEEVLAWFVLPLRCRQRLGP
jgi:hypothetical protein